LLQSETIAFLGGKDYSIVGQFSSAACDASPRPAPLACVNQSAAVALAADRRHPPIPNPARPIPTIIQVAGSGIVDTSPVTVSFVKSYDAVSPSGPSSAYTPPVSGGGGGGGGGGGFLSTISLEV
jgi:hypothetical protein